MEFRYYYNSPVHFSTLFQLSPKTICLHYITTVPGSLDKNEGRRCHLLLSNCGIFFRLSCLTNPALDTTFFYNLINCVFLTLSTKLLYVTFYYPISTYPSDLSIDTKLYTNQTFLAVLQSVLCCVLISAANET
jgi:hypothetical protein